MEANLISFSISLSVLFLFLLIYITDLATRNFSLPLRPTVAKTNFHCVFMNFCMCERGMKWWLCYCDYGRCYMWPLSDDLALSSLKYFWLKRKIQTVIFFESFCLSNRFGPWMNRESYPWRQPHQRTGVVSFQQKDSSGQLQNLQMQKDIAEAFCYRWFYTILLNITLNRRLLRTF